MDKIAVLVPCYNEEKTVRKVVEDFKKELPEATVYVYNNNSTDETVERALEAGAVVRHTYKQGKGNVIRQMFREIDAEVYLMVDGDDTYSANKAREMVDLILNKGADMVVGDRLSSTYFVENKRLFHNTGNSLVRFMVNKMFRVNIRDIMTGYRAFSFEFIKTFPVLSRGFEIETEMSIHAADKNMNIENVIIDFKDRPVGSVSKLNTYTDGAKVLWKIVSMYRTYRPLHFFTYISIILFAVATVAFIPVMDMYLKFGVVPKFPTLIVCGFTVLASIISVFTGLILSSMNKKNKCDFEVAFINAHNRKIDLLCRDKTKED